MIAGDRMPTVRERHVLLAGWRPERHGMLPQWRTAAATRGPPMPMIALLLLLACPLSLSEGGGALFSFETADGVTFLGEWLQFDASGSELATASGRTRPGSGELVLVSGQPAPLSADPAPPQDILLMPARPGAPGLGDRLVGANRGRRRCRGAFSDRRGR